jgi:chemotaxis protein CheD
LQSLSGNKISVRVGEVKVGTGDAVLFAIGLGSCVGIALYDTRVRVGGLAHIMLPHPTSARKPSPPGRFASTAVEFMIEQMVTQGAARRRLFARLIGGAAMFEAVLAEDGPALGTRNIEAARAALAAAKIPLRAELVGGNHGRTVNFFVQDGKILVTSVRQNDVVL